MPAKRLDGRDEPILEPELPIVDSHHHLFDRPELRYLLDEYLADANAGHRIVRRCIWRRWPSPARTTGR